MKKILLFCLLIGGLSSISAKNLTIDVADAVYCEVKVYHMGVYQDTFRGATCGDAWRKACDYVKSKGGTCPIGI